MKSRYLLCTFFLIFSLVTGAQDSVSLLLEKQFTRLRENLPFTEKMIINDSIRQILKPYTLSDSIFRHRFSNLRYLGQITSPDSLLKILSWNIISNDGVNRYFCYLIHRTGTGKPHKVYYLTKEYEESPPGENVVYSHETWYGALYYDVRPFLFGDEICYVLLALDYGNPLITRKIIETLKITPEGNMIFGINCLTDGKKTTRRIVFEYSATAVMSLKFEADTLIVFDHLSPFSPEFNGNHQYYGPDFSFDAFLLKNGLWIFIEDIDIKNKK